MHIIPKKSLGQNFILNVPKEILLPNRALNLQKPLGIIEIGPGTGAITQKVLEQLLNSQTIKNTKVYYYLIELDSRVVPILKNLEQKNKHPNLTINILNQDVLSVDLINILNPQINYLYIFGALPYNISKQIIQWSVASTFKLYDFLGNNNFKTLPYRFIVQKEVALRYLPQTIDANHKNQTSKYDFLYYSLTPATCYTKVTKNLPPGNFFPSPKVTSSILEFKICPIKLKNWLAKYCNVQDIQQNSLAQIYDMWNTIVSQIRQVYIFKRKQLKVAIKKANIPQDIKQKILQSQNTTLQLLLSKRAEDLQPDEWLMLLCSFGNP